MANTPQAKKRVRQAERKRQHNASLRSMARTTIKKTIKAIHVGESDAAQAAYGNMQKTLDRMATKGLISANKAARHKSRLSHKITQLS